MISRSSISQPKLDGASPLAVKLQLPPAASPMRVLLPLLLDPCMGSSHADGTSPQSGRRRRRRPRREQPTFFRDELAELLRRGAVVLQGDDCDVPSDCGTFQGSHGHLHDDHTPLSAPVDRLAGRLRSSLSRCTRCGQDDVEDLPSGPHAHDWNPWKRTQPWESTYRRRCHCGAVETKTVRPGDHRE